MSINRVQKLLFSEYCDFEDMVLIESPFAQTTKDGKGIRQVHLGLTPSKLILATDVLPPVEYVNFKYMPGVDPEIETFELIAIYPVECVNLSIYRKKKTQALKARFCNNKVLYFELGGFEKRAMFWNLWCERVKFLCPGNSGSSRSETSVATSTTGSSLYILDKKFVARNGMNQLWCKFGSNAISESKYLNETFRNRWTDRHLYLGRNFDMPLDYHPVMERPAVEEFVKYSRDTPKVNYKTRKPEIVTYMQENQISIGDTVQINRFGSGIYEGCGTALYLTADEYTVPRRYSELLDEINPPTISMMVNYDQLAESAVTAWERHKDPTKHKVKHRRRYGLVPEPMFINGFFNYNLSSSSRPLKRIVSEICIRAPPTRDSEFNQSLPKHQLTSSISHQFLNTNNNIQQTNSFTSVPKAPFTLFWTPGYKYRPRSAKEVYEDRQKQMKKIRDYYETFTKKKRRKCAKKFMRRFRGKITNLTDEDSNDEYSTSKRRKKKHGLLYNMFSTRIDEMSNLESRRPEESSLQYMKRMLKADVTLNAWDFDSTTLAEQLTMIDKELFLKINSAELDSLLWQHKSHNAPNISAILAFSHRIICLLATEIIKTDTEKSRARLVARFINVANKCHQMSNFQSCRTVLCGLRSPAVYRLRNTWAYVRKKHASKYQCFEFLCRFYRDPRMPAYQKTLHKIAQTPPFLPFIGDIIAKLLSKIPQNQNRNFPLSRMASFETTKTSCTKSTEIMNELKCPNLLTKLLKVFYVTEVNNKKNSIKLPKVKKKFQCTAV